MGIVLGPERAFQRYSIELLLCDRDPFWEGWSQLTTLHKKGSLNAVAFWCREILQKRFFQGKPLETASIGDRLQT